MIRHKLKLMCTKYEVIAKNMENVLAFLWAALFLLLFLLLLLLLLMMFLLGFCFVLFLVGGIALYHHLEPVTSSGNASLLGDRVTWSVLHDSIQSGAETVPASTLPLLHCGIPLV